MKDFLDVLLEHKPLLSPETLSISACVIFFFFVFLGPYLRHVEVPKLGGKLELQLLAYNAAIAMPD